jgi:hypothetical protein
VLEVLEITPTRPIDPLLTPGFQKLRHSAMRPAILAALVLVAAVAATPVAALYSAGNPVVQLNPNNFKSKVLLALPLPLSPRSPAPPPDRLLHFSMRGLTRFFFWCRCLKQMGWCWSSSSRRGAGTASS